MEYGFRDSAKLKKKNKKKPAGGNPLQVSFFSLSVFLSFSPSLLSQPGSAAHGQAHTHAHTPSYTPPPSTHTRSDSLPIATIVSLFLPLFHYVSLLLPSLFLYSPFSFCFLHLPSALPYSPHLSPSIVRSLPPSPFTRFLPPFIFLLPPLSFLCVQSERGHYLSHTGHVRWNGGACKKYSRCKA